MFINKRKTFVGVAGFEPATSASQTRRDNRATLHPECTIFFCGETGTRTLATVTRRQISNLLHYHSGTSPIKWTCAIKIAVANVTFHYLERKQFFYFFVSIFNLIRIFYTQVVHIGQLLLQHLLNRLNFFQSNICIQKLICIHLFGNNCIYKVIYLGWIRVL